MKKIIFLALVLASFAAYGQTSKDYWLNGSKFYSQGNYDQAIKEYTKSLELEKTNRTLDKLYYYVLIDNLGMSYGIRGNIKEAIKTLEYGVSIDSTYPMFYYNLACCYAEQNDIDKTLFYLEIAINYKDNMLEGEKFPNPETDDSFKKFIDNEKFKNVLKKCASSLLLENLKLTVGELPEDYSFTSEENCISIQASIFFNNPKIYEKIIGKVIKKDIQNIENKKEKGCILYFEFESEFKRKEFLGRLLWGGSEPTKDHPETFISKDKFLIIISFNENSPIRTISENKIKLWLNK